jgi:hypothetical protein
MRPQHSLLERFAWLCAALLFVCGGYSVIRRARADWLSTIPDATAVNRALRLDSGNAAYWLKRAELLNRDLESPVDALLHAAALNPFDAGIWIQLGLDAESRGDYPQAEEHLLHAAAVSRRFEPCWTLANYYFRRGSEGEFWKWTRRALELEPESPDAVFELCWRMPFSADEIFAKAIPSRRKVWRDYARFLLAKNRITAAGDVIVRVLPDVRREDRDLLLEACDRFVGANAVDMAMDAWNGLCGQKVISCSAVRDSGTLLLDAAESSRVLGHGFSWHTTASQGVSVDRRSGLTSVEFSGHEPENADIAWRWIPVRPARRGMLSFDYQTSGILPASGLTWQVVAGTNSVPLVSSSSLSNPAWSAVHLPFAVPAGVTLVRLQLNYTRPSGNVRIEGSLAVRALRVELEP